MPLPGWPVMAPNAYDNNNNIYGGNSATLFFSSFRICVNFGLFVDKNSDLDMNKSRQTNGSDGSDKAAAAPMSQISGVRRLQQSNSIVGVVPRFGVELSDEQPLAEVSCGSDYLVYAMSISIHIFGCFDQTVLKLYHVVGLCWTALTWDAGIYCC